ncbi:hypothetical protein E2562_027828 [Oryza meyeriana var. granulata]|uniref:F-box domain-containing protein n=1 Tax=Oryza meyeriana var. granulata TaxID=110450 RepID=A0A6G1DQA4_9ORYZ|nr:hypothetical protein E2562_027828 [Oryza meyeriana var. granulata]
MGGRPVPRRQEVVVVKELELRMQLLGGGGNCYNINDNADLLAEILVRLDGRSLAAAACVCRLWAAVARRDAVWEALCLRHFSFPSSLQSGSRIHMTTSTSTGPPLHATMPPLPPIAGPGAVAAASTSTLRLHAAATSRLGSRRRLHATVA